MSIDIARQFFDKARSDEALQARLRAAATGTGKERRAALIRIAGEAGFSFSAADLDAAVKMRLNQQHAAGELSEDDLEQVAGGARGGGETSVLDMCIPSIWDATCSLPCGG